jgi:signal transduction histidine kinase
MKNHRLLRKIFILFLLFAMASFFVIFFMGTKTIKRYVIRSESSRLYQESNTIASNYGEDYYAGDISLSQLYQQLKTLSIYLDSDIQIIGPSGLVLVDTSKSYVDKISDMQVIEDFDPLENGNRYYCIDDFYGNYSEETLNILSPVTYNYKVRAYVSIHKPISKITESVNQQINLIYQLYLVIIICAFVLFLLLCFMIYRPIRRMCQIAQQYANHNFEKKLNVSHVNDELTSLAASINSMGRELDTLEEDQRKFISNVSHDFRSPLTSIKGYANAMLDGTIPYEMQNKYLDVIVFETERLHKLTQELLILNNNAQGASILNKSDFDINKVIKTTALSFEMLGREKNLSIDLILTGESMFVNADKDRIQQVLYNLIDNAIKFSNPDSVITIETIERNDKIYISVKDKGMGISKECLPKIWDRFYKTDASRGRDKKGTGLGLAIVKEIIQNHGETINVISTENVGTEFTFTLTKVD